MTVLSAVIDGQTVRLTVDEWDVTDAGVLVITDTDGVEHRFGPSVPWTLRSV